MNPNGIIGLTLSYAYDTGAAQRPGAAGICLLHACYITVAARISAAAKSGSAAGAPPPAPWPRSGWRTSRARAPRRPRSAPAQARARWPPPRPRARHSRRCRWRAAVRRPAAMRAREGTKVFGDGEPAPAVPRLGPGVGIEQEHPGERPLGQKLDQVARVARMQAHVAHPAASSRGEAGGDAVHVGSAPINPTSGWARACASRCSPAPMPISSQSGRASPKSARRSRGRRPGFSSGSTPASR